MKVKICGITRPEDAQFAAQLGAWAVGFIFYKKSPRYVDPAAVRAIAGSLRGVLKIGVFVNPSLQETREAIEIADLSGVQLHGDESPGFFESLKGVFGKGVSGRTLLIKAFRPHEPSDLQEIPHYPSADAYLIDAASSVKDIYGGTGKLADWDLARQAKTYGNVILSGGLSPQNISQAICKVEPYAIDVSSSVEESRGIKDHGKLRQFFSSVKEAESKLGIRERKNS